MRLHVHSYKRTLNALPPRNMQHSLLYTSLLTHNRLLRFRKGAVSCKNRSGAYTIDLSHGNPSAVVPVLADGAP